MDKATGNMKEPPLEILTNEQMGAADRLAVELGVPSLTLMENAGRSVADEAGKMTDAGARIAVLCGPGNNGGDGFVVARLLHARGWEVEVFLYGDSKKLPPDARVNYERWRELGEASRWDSNRIDEARADLFVDAVFGTGLARALPAEVSNPLSNLKRYRPPLHRVAAVDAPSGLCLDSGKALVSEDSEDHGTFADLTISFHRMKLGQLLADGLIRCGNVVVADIGLSNDWTEDIVVHTSLKTLTHDEVPQLEKWVGQHKYSHGHALILSGGPGRTGAARLAARGALRIGAGLVTLGVPGSAQMQVASQITAIMLRRVDDAKALAEVLEDYRLTALCLGPGMGLGEASRSLVEAGLTSGRACVLDADALTVIAGDTDLFALLHRNCVLTPHGGEFARLFPDLAQRLGDEPTSGPAYSKVDATRAAAKRAGCVVLFKGPDTVIAAPDGRCGINAAVYDRAAPWLATAGSGDVLAGFVTGLLARRFAPMEAAETAAWLHVEAARKFGPGLIAEDLPETLPAVFRDLGL